MKPVFNFLVLLILLAASCRKKDTPPADTTVTARVITDLAYGSDARQRMDVYLPAGRSANATPLLLLIHGGGWTTGDKAEMAAFVDTLRRRLPAFAVVNMNYRLAGNGVNLFPAQENDVQQAVSFMDSKRAEWGISNRWSIAGASAGAHLAMLQAYKQTTPIRFLSVVNFFGPADLVSFYNNPPSPLVPVLLLTITGTTPAANLAVYQQSSPVNFVTASTPATLILHGGADVVVPVSQSQQLRGALQRAGVQHRFVLYPSGGHGDWDAATFANAFSEVEAFLKTYHR